MKKNRKVKRKYRNNSRNRRIVRRKIIVLLILLLVVASAIIYDSNKKRIVFKLKGNIDVKLELNKEYKENGFVLKSCHKMKCELLDDEFVSVENNIDISKVGVYEVKYKLNYIDDRTLIRKVEVVDTISPVIELIGNSEVVLCPNGKYEEEGYTALDNYDGDITDDVIVEKLEDKYKYSVKDSSNNSAEAFRSVKYEDVSGPQIALNGNNSIKIYLGEEYIESGAVVTDNCDSDVEKTLTISGKVDTKKEGTYTIKYEASDSFGNRSSIERKIVVEKKLSFDTKDFSEYKDSLKRYLDKKNYTVSVGYVNLVNGNTFLYNEDKIYYGASLVKTVDALYAYEHNILDDETKEKVKKAISVSDNSAHSSLVKQFGIENLRKYGRSLGAVNFLTGSNKDYYGNTTVNDQIVIWKYLNNYINNNKQQELKNYFINSYGNLLLFDGIPVTMHKYGYYGAYYHEAGIVLANKPYIVVILTKNSSNRNSEFKDISSKIYGLNSIDK